MISDTPGLEVIRKNRGIAAKIARDLNISKAAVSLWLKRRIPAERVLDVEKATGIPRHDLRPDLYPAQ
jgi:DNA-binding transcriptional regulator YdaS (Cro superfamily)